VDKIDWRSLPASLELDAVIAEALGWVELYVGAAGSGGECLYGRWPGNFPKTIEVPRYSRDANAAFPVSPNDVLEVWVVDKGARASMNKLEWEYGASYAEARAKAWLADFEDKQVADQLDRDNLAAGEPNG
jgi:hypothetical protein